MKRVIKQSLGIDVSKDTLDYSLAELTEDFEVSTRESSQVLNNKKGGEKLLKVIEKYSIPGVPLQVIVEATGVYHELICCFLKDSNIDIAIVMPKKISNYVKSNDIRTMTDKISAIQIAEFGLMKKLDSWKKPDVHLKRIKGLSRERSQLVDERTRLKNQIHAKKYSAYESESILKRMKERVTILERQIEEVEQELKAIVKGLPELKEKVEKMCSIRGVGFITAMAIIGETDGFNLIKNSRQLVCYAGYDVVHKESGSSVKAKGKMSHKGNSYIRRALYFPSLQAVRGEGFFEMFYTRLYKKQAIKLKAYAAVQRKLLIMIYTLWKKDEYYEPGKHKGLKYFEQSERTAQTELA